MSKPNRRQRRVEAQKRRVQQRRQQQVQQIKRNAKQQKDQDGAKDELPFEEKLQVAIHTAIARVVPPGTPPSEVPQLAIVRGLGLIAAAFAAQHAMSLAADQSEVAALVNGARAKFLANMAGYYDGIAKELGVEIEQEGPTLVLP